MGLLDEYLPDVEMPSLSSIAEIAEVGELVAPSIIPSITDIAEILPSIPDIAEIGEVSLGLPDLPSLPSISEVGELVAPNIIPDILPTIAEVGEVALSTPDISRTAEEDEKRRAAGLTEAERGHNRQQSGENVVGMSGDDGLFGEDGPIMPYLFGDNEAMQEFGRLHDVEAAMANEDGHDSTYFTAANVITAGVGGLGTLVSGDAHTGAAMADNVFHMMGFATGDYEGVQSG
jgi:hypothetical protein